MNEITRDQVIEHRRFGSWRNLEQIALSIVADVQTFADSVFQPKLGGGTRLMLALDHRISHDIDLFIRDPQWIGYITPRLNDRVEEVVADYEEAADHLKLNLPEGEIDFIVRGSLLNLPDDVSDETVFPLEPVAEVLAKKLFYRGSLLAPRDLFDWWAIETLEPGLVPRAEMGLLLENKSQGILNALTMLPKSVAAKRLWGEILAPDKPDMNDVIAWGRDALNLYLQAATNAHSRKLETRHKLAADKDPSIADGPEP